MQRGKVLENQPLFLIDYPLQWERNEVRRAESELTPEWSLPLPEAHEWVSASQWFCVPLHLEKAALTRWLLFKCDILWHWCNVRNAESNVAENAGAVAVNAKSCKHIRWLERHHKVQQQKQQKKQNNNLCTHTTSILDVVWRIYKFRYVDAPRM